MAATQCTAADICTQVVLCSQTAPWKAVWLHETKLVALSGHADNWTEGFKLLRQLTLSLSYVLHDMIQAPFVHSALCLYVCTQIVPILQFVHPFHVYVSNTIEAHCYACLIKVN